MALKGGSKHGRLSKRDVHRHAMKKKPVAGSEKQRQKHRAAKRFMSLQEFAGCKTESVVTEKKGCPT